MNEHPLLSSLRGGKRWSTGKAQLAAQIVLREPDLFGVLFSGLTLDQPLARMRAAYAVSKVAAERPDLLQRYKESFLDRLSAPDNSHLARAAWRGYGVGVFPCPSRKSGPIAKSSLSGPFGCVPSLTTSASRSGGA